MLTIGLNNAIVATLLAVVVAVVCFVWRRPALVHVLWLLVLVKLITPPLVGLGVPYQPPFAEPSPSANSPSVTPAPVESPEPVRLVGEPPQPAIDKPADTPEIPERPAVAAMPLPPETMPALEDDPAPQPWSAAVTEPVTAEPASATAWPTRETWLLLLAGAWLGGSLVWFALALRRASAFGRLLRFAEPASADLQDEVHRLAEAIGLARPPSVELLPGALSPMVWAFACRPRLLLPKELLARLDPAQRTALLVHELAHLRRRDHWVRVLEFVVTGLYWWLPVAWLARRQLREAEEHCCDAWVLAVLPGQSRSYASALVETVEFVSRTSSPAPALASGLSVVRHLKRRMTMILQERTGRRMGWLGGLAALALAIGFLPLAPIWGDEPRKAPREGEQPRVTPREGEQPRVTPREGEQPRPRDGEKPRFGPRDGEKPREGGEKPRDGDPRKPEKPRDGDIRKPVEPRNPNIEELRRHIEDLTARLREAEARLRQMEGGRLPPREGDPTRPPVVRPPLERPINPPNVRPADFERRLDELEKKVDRLIQMLERREPAKPRDEGAIRRPNPEPKPQPRVRPDGTIEPARP